MVDGELLEAIKRKLELEGLKSSSIRIRLSHAKKLPITREELEQWLVSVKPNTRANILYSFKKFIEYGFVDEALIKDIPIPIKQERELTKQDLISPEEFQTLLAKASNRDKAILAFMYETGARIAEALTMERKHFLFLKDRISSTIHKSKTKKRSVSIILYQQYLIQFLKERGDWQGLFFFYKDEKKTKYKTKSQDQLTDQDIACMTSNFRYRLKRIAAAAGLDKKIYPHLARHSASFRFLKTLTKSSARERLGHSKKSNTTERYYDLIDDEEADEEYLAQFGLAKTRQNEIRLVTCTRCGNANNNLDERCAVCGSVLKIDYDLEEDAIIWLKTMERDDVQETLLKALKEERRKLKNGKK
ncbi:MAG: tyrosine-type recombinase/integrase [Candidatus Thorarchaeota archaeon]